MGLPGYPGPKGDQGLRGEKGESAYATKDPIKGSKVFFIYL
jgi:hypothetical protein